MKLLLPDLVALWKPPNWTGVAMLLIRSLDGLWASTLMRQTVSKFVLSCAVCQDGVCLLGGCYEGRESYNGARDAWKAFSVQRTTACKRRCVDIPRSPRCGPAIARLGSSLLVSLCTSSVTWHRRIVTPRCSYEASLGIGSVG